MSKSNHDYKIKDVELDIRLIAARHGNFVSDIEAEQEVKSLAKVVMRNLNTLKDDTPKSFYKKSYDSMMKTIEMVFKDAKANNSGIITP